jgi:predicted nucleic acid-binding protein
MIVVSDTTALNYLILIDYAHVLPALFGRVYAPSAVIRELAHPRSPKLVRRWTDSLPEWVTVEEPTHIDPLLKLGPGEAAAITLAEELKADCVLLDERKGSREAESRGFPVAGTLGIIEQAGVKNLLDYDQTRNRHVVEATFYVTDDVLRESERRFRDRKLAQEPTEEKQGPSPPRSDEDRSASWGIGE